MPPPRKTPSNSASANNARGNKGYVSPQSTPRRVTRSHLARVKKTSPEGATSSGDELAAQDDVLEESQANANRPQLLDEIAVSRPDSVNAEGGALNESTRSPRSRSRSSSISKSESATKTPSRRGTPIKKQDFQIAATADDEEDELAAEEPASKKPKTARKPIRLATFRKGRSKWDNPDEMLTNPNSPLVKTDLRDILCSSKAWDILTPEEKQRVLTKFPDKREILDADTPDNRPNIAALRNNDNFRHDVAQYQQGLSQGYHDPEWIRQAQAAHRARHAGVYDELLAAEFEEKWDTPMPGVNQTGNELRGGEGSSEQQQSNGEFIQSRPVPLPDGETVETHGADNAHLLRGVLAEAAAQDPPGQSEGMYNTAVIPADSALNGDATKQNSLLEEDSVKQLGSSAEAEMLTTQATTETDDQHLRDAGHEAVRTNNLSSLPHLMEGVEQRKEEEAKKEEKPTVAAQTDQKIVMAKEDRHDIRKDQPIVETVLESSDAVDKDQRQSHRYRHRHQRQERDEKQEDETLRQMGDTEHRPDDEGKTTTL